MKTVFMFLCLTAAANVATDTYPDKQAQVRKRLDELWASCAKRDLDRLASFHLYGPKFTEFKDGEKRGDAMSGAAKEKAFFGQVVDGPTVDMKDLKIDVFGDTAVVTFNGHFTGKIEGKPVAVDQGTTLVFVSVGGDWKIVHEHFSQLGGPPAHP